MEFFKWVGYKMKKPTFPKDCVFSCDASIKKNPGGPSSIGVTVQIPDSSQQFQTMEVLSRFSPAVTNNQAEYDAVYEALGQIERMRGRVNKFGRILIHSDSQLVVKQIKGEYKCGDEILERKRECIVEKLRDFVKEGFPPIFIEWFPRNSTEGLKQANNAAQELLNVKKH